MKRVSTVVVALMAFMFSGCLKTRSELRGETSDPEMQRQTTTQQRAQAQSPTPPPPLKEPKPASAAARFEEIDQQMRELNGKVDNNENRMNEIQAVVTGEKESVTKMAQAIDQKFLVYEEIIKKLETQVADLTAEVTRLKGADQASTPASGPVTGKGARTAYDEAETLFAGKKWKDAILKYQEYRDAYPKGKQYADATYKIGVCFQELKMKMEAKTFFDEVIAKFPGSKEAKKASTRAKSMK